MPPLILHVLHHLVIGGMENGVVNLINRMPPSRFRHAIACIEGFSDFRERLCRDDVGVFPLERSRVGVWTMRRRLYALCRRMQPAIIHTRNLSGLDALLPACMAGVPYRVHSEHGWDVDDLRGDRIRPALLRKLHSPFVTRYVVVSKDLERYLVRRVGVSASRITQIYNGVDILMFHPAKNTNRTLLPTVAGNEPSFVVGTVGRIQAVKGHRTLLSAFAEMLRIMPDLRPRALLAVIGDGPLRSDLRNQAATLGIVDQVWLPGSRSDVAEILRSLDVFVLPSLNEGISNTILEAMASGLPVIATDVGGNPELVAEGITGHLLPACDGEALGRALVRYAAAAGEARAMGRAGRLRAERFFSLDGMVAEYTALYERLLRGPMDPANLPLTPESTRVSTRGH